MQGARVSSRSQATVEWRPERVRSGWVHVEGAQLLERLTQREFDVIRHIAWGWTNAEAGENLGISARTVEIHRRNAISKLGARNTADAVRIFVTESYRARAFGRSPVVGHEVAIFSRGDARR